MEKFVWIVCYVDITKIDTIERALAKNYRVYGKIVAYIPTIKVLSKTFKKRNEYKDVPLLFNYGFFKVPEYFLYNEEFLRNMKRDFDCIYQWLRDTSKQKIKKTKKIKIPTVATVSQKEIEKLKEVSTKYSTYSKEQIDQLKIGQTVTLKTYPFENLMVKIESIDRKRKEVMVELLSDMGITPRLKISFDHIFYTIYNTNNLTGGFREQSLDEMVENGFSLDYYSNEWH